MTIFVSGTSAIPQSRPGVQIINVPPQVVAAQPQSSNVIAIVGTASWGPFDQAVPVGTPIQASQIFGPVQPRAFDLGTAVYVTWLQGATNFVLVRASLPGQLAATAPFKVGSDSSAGATFTAKWPGTVGNNITVTVSTGSKLNTLKVTIALPGVKTETYNNLPKTSATVFWTAVASVVNNGSTNSNRSELVVVTDGAGTTLPSPGATIHLGSLTTGGTDGVDATDYGDVAASDLLGSASGVPTGMYALAKTPINHLVLADADSTAWAAIDAFAAANGVYAHVAGPEGQDITSAVTLKQQTAALDSAWTSVTFGDWPTIYDGSNHTFRKVSPALFKAGVLGSLAPNNTALNKPLRGVVSTQRSGDYANSISTYSDAEIGTLLNAGIDIIANPSPGGTYHSFAGGLNSSSDASVNSDSWPMMESAIGRAIASVAGQYIGRPFTDQLEFDVQTSIESILANFVYLGLLNPGSYNVVCDTSNNPFSSTSLGFLVVNASVTFMSVVRFFECFLEGGATVQATKVSSGTIGGGA